MAVAQLWENESLDLDDRVGRHIPEFARNGKEAITLRHLLTHTAGLRRLGLPWPEGSWEEVIEWICQLRLESGWVPGERAQYNRAITWFVLGEIVQRVSGIPYWEYLRKRVLEPMDMQETWVGLPGSQYSSLSSRIAPLFDTSRPQAQPQDFTDREMLTNPSPGRSAIGPIRQLGRFYEVMLGGGLEPKPAAQARSPAKRPETKKALLRRQTIEAMTACHRVGLEDRTFRSKLDWGLGLIIDSKHYGNHPVPYGYGRFASRRTFGHSGYQSSAGFADPLHGLVVALIFNGTPGAEAHETRLNAVLDTLYLDLGLGA